LIHFTDADVDRALEGADLEGALRDAFVALAEGRAALQERVRTDADGVKLSTLGGVLPGTGFAGAKVYTTIAGRFNFVIVLFSAQSGEPLATFDANAITRRRTAAVSVIAARRFAPATAESLAVFGTGTQARAHVEAFRHAFPLRSVRVVSRSDARDFASDLRSTADFEVRVCAAREALDGASLVVTATRSSAALFEGGWLCPGAFVAAVGSSKPDARETDDATLSRARAVVVEWKAQSLREAGDLVLANPEILSRVPIIDLGDALRTSGPMGREGGDVTLFKSVGVGLEDVAAAGLAWQSRAR